MFTKISRRRFLGTAGAMAASPMILPAHVWAEESPNEKMNFACIGLGGQMMNYCHHELCKVQDPRQVVAICDVDRRRLDEVRDRFSDVRQYHDYRELLDKEDSVDAVLIGTPDHWHVPILKAALKKKKHVYCEKPLTHSVAESREVLEAVAAAPECATQTGNQGCATDGFRRSYEIIQAGILGQITDLYIWHEGASELWGMETPQDADAIPEGLDWDFWLGPAPVRPYKNGLYHPGQWRAWWDFGGGFVTDFCCHSFPLTVRSLGLKKPTHVDYSGDFPANDAFPKVSEITMHFAAEGDRGPVKIHFHTGTMKNIPDVAKRGLGDNPNIGCVVVGERGTLNSGMWNTNCAVRWHGEDEYFSPSTPEFEAAPRTLPRIDTDALNWNPRLAAKGERPKWSAVNSTHMLEWVMACQGDTKTFSPFEVGAHLTEIGMIALLACRLGRGFQWDDAAMKVVDAPEADAWIKPALRDKYLPN